MNLCDTPRLEAVQIEFTSSCNLKCSYCAVSQPDYVARDLEEQTLEQIIADAVSLRVEHAVVNGHGETTSLPGWQTHARRLIDAGIKVSAISNLSKQYSAEELDTLARFHVLVISIDTIDIDTFKHLRRGGDLRRVIYNIGAVRAHAKRLGLTPPVFRWASVVCDRTVFDLPALVNYGLAFGIKDFSFQNVVKMPSVRNALEVSPIAAMPAEDLARVPQIFDEIEQVIAAHGGTCEIQPGIREAIAAATGSEQVAPIVVGSSTIYRVDKSGQKMTRDCIDPWNNAHVTSDGSVKPCCIMRESIGQVGAGHSLRDIVDGPLIREYRESILTGELKGSCQDCHSRGWITPEVMADKVRAYVDRSARELAPSAAPQAIIPASAVSGSDDPARQETVTAIEVPVSDLKAEIDKLRKQLVAMERSTCWRITAPLRTAKGAAERAMGLR